MARLFDCFRPLFLFGVELDAGVEAGTITLPLAELQRRALDLLEHARAAAQARGTASLHVESASFAMVAWIDEILSRLDPPPNMADAMPPLQVQLFNSSNAHSEFFHHLAALQPEEAEVREIYWHVLMLGFKGQYDYEGGIAGELGKLKDLHGQQLPLRALHLDESNDEHLTPQPYDVADPRGPRMPERRQRALMRSGAATLLLLPLLYLLYLLLASDASALGP